MQLILRLSDGRRLVLPRENLQWVADATQEQAADFNIQAPGGPMGTRIWWPHLDEGLSLEGLLEGRTGNEKWMAKIERREVAAWLAQVLWLRRPSGIKRNAYF